MSANIRIEIEGRRHYLVGDTYQARSAIKAAGLRWDPDRKAWWTGKADTAAAALEAALAVAPAQSQTTAVQREPTRPTTRSTGIVALIGETGTATSVQRRDDRRSMPPNCHAEIGMVLRGNASRQDGLAGKPLIVIGCSAVWTSAEYEEDCGQPGTRSGWWVTRHLRLATEAEAAPMLAREAAERAAAEAKASTEADRLAAWTSARESATAGLEPTTWAEVADSRDVLATLDGSPRMVLSRGTIGDEPVVMVETFSFDDYRRTTYARAEWVHALHVRRAAEFDIDVAEAKEWLAKYGGCVGAELYRQIAGQA